MKINELMVGDWVSVSGKPVKITKDDLETMLIFLDDDSKIGPIPLTEEILVKNGFKRSERWHNCTMRTSDDFRICVQFKCGGGVDYITIMKHFNDLINRDVDVALSIHYVHQLQRLLRLCGIDKEIEL